MVTRLDLVLSLRRRRQSSALFDISGELASGLGRLYTAL